MADLYVGYGLVYITPLLNYRVSAFRCSTVDLAYPKDSGAFGFNGTLQGDLTYIL